MKFAAIIAGLFAISITQAIRITDAVDDVKKMQKDMKDAAPVQASADQSTTIDALSQSNLDNLTCTEQLNYTQAGLEQELEYWSRNLTVENYQNAMKIWQNLTDLVPTFSGKLTTKTYELYDKAFVFSRVRRYQEVVENLDMLEHFEDNLNMNPLNSQALANFLRVGTTVRKNMLEKYGGESLGGFIDPALTDPYEETKADFKDFSSDGVF